MLFGMPPSSSHRCVLLLGEEDHAAGRFLKFPLAYFSGFGSTGRNWPSCAELTSCIWPIRLPAPACCAISCGKRATLMRRMGLEAVYRKPRTTHRHSAHTIYPYLLRDLTISRPNHVWAADITYSTPSQRSPPVWG
ncbi:hypothetical protein NSPZN2_70240 [Nitrospira defluvii]|uniref:Transposase n=1 Tax=Nitrospira defluvii TaxID=330214 RepID=A0ABN7MH87_9BACT|nr:hypothetical protein NSPZN2_70240 [Nitrospira defluvii]